MRKNVGLFVNYGKDTELTITRQLMYMLINAGLNPVLTQQTAARLGMGGVTEEELFSGSSCIFVLGGDGTILSAVKRAAAAGKPVLGVNMGRVGFLAEIEVSELETAVKAVANGTAYQDERMMLSCTTAQKSFFALNEIALHRKPSQSVIKLAVYADGRQVNSFYADGVIVATPTGSTAYNLSAGGPIASPNAKVMLLTPVCAHTLGARPFVFGQNEVLQIKTDAKSANLECDGQAVQTDGVITISAAAEKAKFLCVKDNCFYSKLGKKLNEWSISDI